MPSSRTSTLKVRLATTIVTCARVACECLTTVDAGTDTSAGEQGRKDPVGQLAKLGVALLGVIERRGEQRLHALPPTVGRSRWAR